MFVPLLVLVPFMLLFVVLVSPFSFVLYFAKIDSKEYFDVPGPFDSSSFLDPLNLDVPLVLLELLFVP